jgi:acetyltransferase-like isoleucine patch superfamily enzyme
MISEILNSPWKIENELWRWLALPYVRLRFALVGISWGKNWRMLGVPIIQKHRQSRMHFGNGLQLRSSVRSNPLGPNHPVILCTWQPEAVLEIGANCGMTGGSLVAAERIVIGNNVLIGANTIVIDTDFHPLDPLERRLHPANTMTAPVVIEDDVFVGMNSLILKGAHIGRGSIIGAGSVATKSIPAGVIVAGNPAQIIRSLG